MIKNHASEAQRLNPCQAETRATEDDLKKSIALQPSGKKYKIIQSQDTPALQKCTEDLHLQQPQSKPKIWSFNFKLFATKATKATNATNHSNRHSEAPSSSPTIEKQVNNTTTDMPDSVTTSSADTDYADAKNQQSLMDAHRIANSNPELAKVLQRGVRLDMLKRSFILAHQEGEQQRVAAEFYNALMKLESGTSTQLDNKANEDQNVLLSGQVYLIRELILKLDSKKLTEEIDMLKPDCPIAAEILSRQLNKVETTERTSFPQAAIFIDKVTTEQTVNCTSDLHDTTLKQTLADITQSNMMTILPPLKCPFCNIKLKPYNTVMITLRTTPGSFTRFGGVVIPEELRLKELKIAVSKQGLDRLATSKEALCVAQNDKYTFKASFGDIKSVGAFTYSAIESSEHDVFVTTKEGFSQIDKNNVLQQKKQAEAAALALAAAKDDSKTETDSTSEMTYARLATAEEEHDSKTEPSSTSAITDGAQKQERFLQPNTTSKNADSKATNITISRQKTTSKVVGKNKTKKKEPELTFKNLNAIADE